MAAHAVVKDIRLYPIKSMQGLSLKAHDFGEWGLEMDRSFCVVDLHGTKHAKLEYLSARKCPQLLSITVAMSKDQQSFVLTAPGMEPLSFAAAESAYKGAEDVTVSCSGISTTTGGGWRLGNMKSKHVGEEAATWLTSYLNRVHPTKERVQYALIRSIKTSTRQVMQYAGPKQSKDSPFNLVKADVKAGDRVRFQDFAPFLIANAESLKDLHKHMDTKCGDYSIHSFRPNIIFETKQGPWAEETWQEFTLAGRSFRRIKECPRCTIPCRDINKGTYFAKDRGLNSLLPTHTLAKMFPEKAQEEEEWGTWKGAFFGVYVACDGASGRLAVGDALSVTKYKPGVNVTAFSTKAGGGGGGGGGGEGGLAAMVRKNALAVGILLAAAAVLLLPGAGAR